MSSIQATQAIQAGFESQFAKFKADMRKGHEDAATAALRCARHDKPYSYKKKGNEEQAILNARVDEAFAKAESILAGAGAGTWTALERMQQSLQKGRKLLAERQKLIRIVGRSELGWSVVTKYTADELADDSDDEKRLKKAEKATERKARKRKKKRTEPPFPKLANRFGMALPASIVKGAARIRHQDYQGEASTQYRESSPRSMEMPRNRQLTMNQPRSENCSDDNLTLSTISKLHGLVDYNASTHQ